MSNFNPADSGYVEVKDRIEAFYKKYPEGSIQTEIVLLNDKQAVMKAIAFRSAEDTRPSIGHSQLAIPGTTSFTRGSELENAETSAVGRAIANAGFEVKKSVASADEVRAKQTDTESAPYAMRDEGTMAAERDEQAKTGDKATTKQKNLIRVKAREAGISDDELKQIRLTSTGKRSSADFTSEDVDAMLQAIETAASLKKATGGEIIA